MIRLLGIAVVFGLVATTSSYAGGGTSANSVPADSTQMNGDRPSFDYTVVPFDRYEEADGLPPVLKITFQLKCFQRFVKVVRHDEAESATGKVTIAVGALVYENLLAPCESAQDLTVDAGTTFSGREHQVVAIQ